MKKTRVARSQQKQRDLEVSDIDEDEGEGNSFCFYGRSGTGKTTLAADFPKPMLYIDVKDKGTKSIRDVKGIKRRRISSFEDFEDTYWWLVDNPEVYDTVVVDTLSQLQTMIVSERFGGKKRRGRDAGDWGTMTKRDWGDVAALMKEWIINYRDLTEHGMDVIFIAQDRVFNLGEDEDEPNDEIAPEVGPALSPSVVRTLNASVDFLCNTFIRSRFVTEEKNGKKRKVEKIDYCLRVGPNSSYVTKVRKPKSMIAPAVVADPTYDDIQAIIKGEY